MNPPRDVRVAAAALAALLAALLLAPLAGCGRGGEGEAHSVSDPHGHGEEGHEEAFERGPHGGRLFHGPGVRLEMAIAEEGIPPEFRAYVYDSTGRPRPPGSGRLAVTLTRFGGREERIPFVAERDRFRGTRTVVEPHSYAARVEYRDGARTHVWEFEQEEGRVTLDPAAAAAAGIATGRAGPREIEVAVETPGEVHLNAERVVQIRPRFPGVVRSLEARLGEVVAEGRRIAVIHSNESLSDYEITAPMGGTVVARDAVAGQAVGEGSVLCTIADLTTVWVDFPLIPGLAGRVRPGQTVRIRAEAVPGLEAETRVQYVGPLLEQDTRVSQGRASLPNPRGEWQPGLFVTASVVVERARVAVAVPEEALVRTALGPAVFRAAGGAYELQPVTPGRTDGRWTEILAGLAAGDSVVVRQTFLLKAELGKSEASHEH